MRRVVLVIRSADGRPLLQDGEHCYVTAELLDQARAGDCDQVTVEGDLLTVTAAGSVRRYRVGALVGGFVHELEPV